MNKLETTQRWLTSIIIRPGNLHDKILAADKTYQLDNEKVVRSSAGISSENRISIYARGYVLRLMECMSAEYSSLRDLLGEELFNTFVQAYLVRVPPHSPSLFDLGADFPAFLKASQPQKNNKEGQGENMFDLPVELAQLERARAEAAISKGLEDHAVDLETDDALFYLSGSFSFKTSPCLRLLESQFELLDFIRTSDKGEKAATPVKRINYVAISRKNYFVNMQEIESWQWHYLKALQETSDHIASIKITAKKNALPEETILADLLLWLPMALEWGYVYKE